MKLARVNTALVVVIALINLSIIVLPALPAILFSFQKNSPQAAGMRKMVRDTAEKPIGKDAEQLIVPSMVLDTPVLEGTKRVLDNGVWRLPNTSTPDKGSNTVIVAHRFTYTNPQGTFYHLDKIKTDDPIIILWHGKKYLYRVNSIEQVKADRIEVEAPTRDPQLTLYTCTPLWNPKDRLVVTAHLESVK